MNSMHRNNRNYSYLSPSSLSISRRLNNQQSFHPSTAPTRALNPQQQYQSQSLTAISDLGEPISIFDDLKFPPQRQNVPSPFPPVYLSARQALPPPAATDPRLATVSVMRERLLVDIQQNMKEIDREITSLEERSIILRYNPSPVSSFINSRQTSFEKHSDNRSWPKKPRKVYSVVPRITSQPKKNSASVVSTQSSRITLPSYVGKYHYGPETSESVIRDGDPENSELKLVTKEIPKSILGQQMTLDKFRREQSGAPQNRALIFVPQYDDKSQNGFDEKVDNFQQSYLTDSDTARISTVPSTHASGSANRIKIQNVQSFTYTPPKPKLKSPASSNKSKSKLTSPVISPPIAHKVPEPKMKMIPKSPALYEKVEASLINSMASTPVTHVSPEPKVDIISKSPTVSSPITHVSPSPKAEIIPKSPTASIMREAHLVSTLKSPPVTHTILSPSKVQAIPKSPKKATPNLVNTMISAPIKHTRGSQKPDKSHSPSLQLTKQGSDVDTAYFFSEYGNQGEGEEDLISIDPGQFILPAESENVSDDNLSDTLVEQSQVSVLNSHSIQDQQSIMHHNDEFKERGSKTPGATTIHTITPNSTLPSKNAFLTQHVNRSQKDEALTTISNDDTIPHSPDSLLATDRKASSKTMDSIQQRTLSIDRSSQNQSPYIVSRGVSISSGDGRKLSGRNTSIESLPVPLNSPDSNDVRPSASRSTTPERRDSISAIDSNILLMPIDVSNLLDPPMNSERDIPSPLVNLESLQENRPSRHNDRSDTYRKETTRSQHSSNQDQIDYEEVFPRITASQRRSKLSLIIQRPKPKEKTPIDESLPPVDVPPTNPIPAQNPERHVAFAAEVAHEPVRESAPPKTWRERIDDILTKQVCRIYFICSSKYNAFILAFSN